VRIIPDPRNPYGEIVNPKKEPLPYDQRPNRDLSKCGTKDIKRERNGTSKKNRRHHKG